MTETELQILSARWLALKLPKTFMALHIPNEGRRSWAEGKRMKARGLVAGAPDWLVVGWSPRDAWGAIGFAWAIELKSAKGTLSPAQKAFHKRLETCGVPVAICRSLEEIEAALKGWGVLP